MLLQFQDSLNIAKAISDDIYKMESGGNYTRLIRQYFPQATLIECRDIYHHEIFEKARKQRNDRIWEENQKLENSKEAEEFYRKRNW